jgi:hypothetical protein
MTNIRASIAKELHKQSRKHFPTRHVELKGLNDLYQADLVEMIPFAGVNKGYRYILTMINCFSKYAIVVPLKTKRADEIVAALKPILENHKMKNFQTDQGTEWFNSKVQSLLQSYGINHYYTYSDKKASIVERFNRTLKGEMWKSFSELGSFKWLEILPDLLKKYNNKKHRTIGVRPIDVTQENENEILRKIVSTRKQHLYKHKFKVGDKVRISLRFKQLTKGYWPRWSNEIYTVWKTQLTNPPTYILKDYKGEVLKGGFYQEELSKTNFNGIYLIEKVIRRKGNKLLVRWLGFDKTHDSWIDESKLV